MEIEASNASAFVKRVRRATGMTQEGFAHAIGVTVSTVNRWEQARDNMSRLPYLTIVSYVKMRGVCPLEVQNCSPEPPPFITLPNIAIPNPKKAGSMLRKFRADAGGITQEELAYQMGVTTSTINRWENAHVNMSRLAFNFLRRLAIAQDIELDLSAF